MSLGTLGKYERLSVLGRGVSGIVYLAKDTLLNRQVALKEVDVQAGDLRRFLEEARVMDRLRHPNIVRVNGIDRIDDKVVIDMEYVRGRNLQETLRAEGPLGIPRSLDIGLQVLDALEYAHSMQTVHRDIKPANILLGKDGVVKLADFGLAEILATNAYVCGAGTYAYMAPEDFEEENHSDSQSDIWAVSVTMFEMMTGCRPFDVSNPKSPFSWKRALESQDPCSLCTFLPEASPTLGAIIARGLARDKDVRYLTAREFRFDLTAVYAELPPATRTTAEVPMQSVVAHELISQPTGLPPRDTYTDNVWAGDRHRMREREQHSTQTRTETGADTDTVVSVPAQKLIELNEKKRKQPLMAFRGRIKEARLAVSPVNINFGSVRSGESRQTKLHARISNLVGKSGARVVSASDWVSVEPTEFDASRQTLHVTAHTVGAPTLGAVEARIRIETRAGALDVPVQINILKRRPTFRQIAHWFVPLFGIALAPSIITAILGSARPALVPPAAVSTLALGLMLLVIAAAADTGIGERLACGVMMACMCFVLGLSVAASQRSGYNGALNRGVEIATVTGIGLGLLLIVQFLTAKRWKFWGVVLTFLGILLSGVCYHVAVS